MPSCTEYFGVGVAAASAVGVGAMVVVGAIVGVGDGAAVGVGAGSVGDGVAAAGAVSVGGIVASGWAGSVGDPVSESGFVEVAVGEPLLAGVATGPVWHAIPNANATPNKPVNTGALICIYSSG